METILVTGGCGYIGSHACVSLLENNYNVVIIDSLVNSFENSINNIKKIFKNKSINIENRIEFIKGDLRNKKLLDEVFSRYLNSQNPIKSVIHFAGLKSISASIKHPLLYWESNINSTLSLLSSMKENNCFSLIFSSSASVYKPNGKSLLNEEDIIEPLTPYGKTKACIEGILKDLYQSDNNWRIANLRYFNPVGSHSSGFLNEKSKGKPSNLFPSIFKAITDEQEKLLVFGKDWPTYDGTCIRDFIHVMDLANAHIAALGFLEENKPQNISINIGTGKGTSVLEIIKTFQEIKGINFDYEFVDRRIGDQPFVVADNALALKLLSWSPIRNISDMCNDYVFNKKSLIE